MHSHKGMSPSDLAIQVDTEIEELRKRVVSLERHISDLTWLVRDITAACHKQTQQFEQALQLIDRMHTR